MGSLRDLNKDKPLQFNDEASGGAIVPEVNAFGEIMSQLTRVAPPLKPSVKPICAECDNLVIVKERDFCYDKIKIKYCLASPIPEERDSISGEITTNPYKKCKQVNSYGQCKVFTPKPPKSKKPSLLRSLVLSGAKKVVARLEGKK